MTSKPLDLSQFDNHTPSPWEWKLNTVTNLKGETLTYPNTGKPLQNGYTLSGVIQTDLHDGTPWSPDRIDQANARLIAAAPDLLAEVKELRAYRDKMEERMEVLRKWERDRQLTEVHPQAKVALMIMEGKLRLNKRMNDD